MFVYTLNVARMKLYKQMYMYTSLLSYMYLYIFSIQIKVVCCRNPITACTGPLYHTPNDWFTTEDASFHLQTSCTVTTYKLWHYSCTHRSLVTLCVVMIDLTAELWGVMRVIHTKWLLCCKMHLFTCVMQCLIYELPSRSFSAYIVLGSRIERQNIRKKGLKICWTNH